MADYLKSGKFKGAFKLKKPDYSFSKREVLLISVLVLFALIVGAYAYRVYQDNKKVPITNFEECAAARNPILETYPEQCVAGEQTFVKQY